MIFHDPKEVKGKTLEQVEREGLYAICRKELVDELLVVAFWLAVKLVEHRCNWHLGIS